MLTKPVLTLAVVAFAAMLAGCAGRPAAPVAANQPGDTDKSCNDLLKEVNYNQYLMAREVRESNHVKAGNADTVGGDAFFMPLLLTRYDKGKAQSIELKALQVRNANLTKMAIDKDC
jgi:type IV pilus biogenesis protein CpaD/CtpE